MIKIIIKYRSLNFTKRKIIENCNNSLNKEPAICNSYFVFSIIYLYFSEKIYSKIKLHKLLTMLTSRVNNAETNNYAIVYLTIIYVIVSTIFDVAAAYRRVVFRGTDRIV